ncbi:hypothetical protein NGM44_03620 [Moraxella sp. FZFQ2102]|uniref:hypothetical protein n=1 Tax=Moraxella sp. FZFQ2102 TaxID=2953752 RepID=UPI00209BE92D|nr:hypothetical protein [Moraxella sp. FZFQ2102]USZ15480.1 hypothetical protein NGM44_03620 [Moraxella sp. FZFQ2102]
MALMTLIALVFAGFSVKLCYELLKTQRWFGVVLMTIVGVLDLGAAAYCALVIGRYFISLFKVQ